MMLSLSPRAQVLGGNAVFPFLRHPLAPQLTALGGVEIAKPSNDASMAFHQPALLRPEMHTQMNAAFNDQYGGIRGYHLSMAYRAPTIGTQFLWGLNYFDYGRITRTDASGNEYGHFRPSDWVMQVSASRAYEKRWHYGATLKYIHSNYGAYRADGMALDFGIHYTDSAGLFAASALLQNAGTQFRNYEGSEKEQLPFELKFGLYQRLRNAPFSFSLTAQRMQRFNISYEDSADNRKFSFSRLIRHFVVGANIHLSDRAEFHLSYNVLRRKELSIGDGGDGLSGFAAGLSVNFGKLQIRYARAYYQPRAAINQLGVGMTLNRYFSLGKFGERLGW